MKYFLFILSLLFPFCTQAEDMQTFVTEQLASPVLDGAWWGGLAAQDTQEEIFSVQADTRLTPASALKLLTTAAALETFGPEHRFETRLYASQQPNKNGVLHGDLYLQGGADPTLGSTRVVGGETWQTVVGKWVNAIQKANIQRVEGHIYADVSAFEGPSIPPKVNWENIGNYYAAPASPLCFNDNSFKIKFAPQPFDGKPVQVASMEPQVPGVTLKSFVTASAATRQDNAYVYGAPNQYELEIYGTIPTNLTGFTIQAALPNSALFAAQALRDALQKAKISVSGTPQTTAKAPDYAAMIQLHTYYSPKLKDIVLIVNKRSFNLYAEMLLRQLALHAGKKGSVQNGVEALNQFLTKNKLAGKKDTVIYDGSGLSRDNMLTPRTLVNTLAFMAKSPHFEPYYNSLATPNDRGDLLLLRRFLQPKGKVSQVRVKGGTIDGVKALAGYVRDKKGRLIAFALMANNLPSKDEKILRIHENIIKKLMELPQK